MCCILCSHIYAVVLQELEATTWIPISANINTKLLPTIFGRENTLYITCIMTKGKIYVLVFSRLLDVWGKYLMNLSITCYGLD